MWTKPKPIKPLHTRAIPPATPGVYRLHNGHGTVIYTGRSNDLERRISHYHQKDDFTEHPTKRAVRKEATHFSFTTVRSKKKRRKMEKKLKKGKKYNFL